MNLETNEPGRSSELRNHRVDRIVISVLTSVVVGLTLYLSTLHANPDDRLTP